MLQYVTGDDDAFFDSMLALADHATDWPTEPTSGLEAVERWRDDVVIALLRLRNSSLADAVLNGVRPEPDQDGRALTLDDLDWWLDWLEELTRDSDHIFTAYLMGLFLARNTSPQTREEVLRIFNEQPIRRRLLAERVLYHFPELTVAELDDDAVEWLFTTLDDAPRGFAKESVLSRVATERMVQERLIPLLLSHPDEEAKANLVTILRQVGRRHGRRYVGDDGEILVGVPSGGGF